MTAPADLRLHAIERETGSFAMVALDQRESMRSMFAAVRGAEISDETLRWFKREAADVLAQQASAILLDHAYGLDGGRPPGFVGRCALILAADRLEHAPGGSVVKTDLDPDVTAELAHAVGAVALKLLVLWRPDGGREQRTDLVGRFLELCGRAELPGIVEGVVRPPTGASWDGSAERYDAVLGAAAELGASGPDLYKAEVPGSVTEPPDAITHRSAELTRLLPCPWVVLSSGVVAADFPEAVERSCRGGASGFLAGRAIWADSIAQADPVAHLRTEALARVERLVSIVDSCVER